MVASQGRVAPPELTIQLGGRAMRKWTALGMALAGFGLSGVALGKAKFNLDHPHVPSQLLVTFQPGVKLVSTWADFAKAGIKIAHTYKSGAMLLQLPRNFETADLERQAGAIARLAGVKSVEANTIMTIDRVPNDARFGELYAMNNTGATGGTVDADIDAVEAWDVTTGSRDVLVGVIDTGVDYTHPDIAANYWTNAGESGLDANGADKKLNGVDDDANGFVDDFRGWDFVNNDNDPMDDNNHGTHCSGTIGGVGNDGVGVAGVNWEVSIVGIKFLSGAGSGTLADAVKAIEYATTINVMLSSNSWGGGGFSDTMDAAIRAAEAKGILFVAAAGNSSSDNDRSPHYPSSYAADNVIAVAATDHNDGMASFSSYGATSVDLGAPGVDILSSTPGNKYDSYDGTSMATPHVSGVAALVKSRYPEATGAQIKARLLNTVDPVSALAGKTLTGGRVNAFNALETDTVAPGVASGLAVDDAGTTFVVLGFDGTGDDGDTGNARRYEVRYGADAIDSEAKWASARVAAIVSGERGARITARLAGLPFNSEGFLAVKAVDNVGNIGGLSESVPFATRQVTKLAENRAESMDGVTAEAPWGVEAEAARAGNAFSDSPGAQYANDLDVEMTLATFELGSSDATLTFSTAWDFESGYDFGIVEASGDGGATWTELDKLSGTASWTDKSYDLSTVLSGSTSLTLRFRVTSDYSIVKDGWKIDDIAIFGPAE